MPFVKGQKKTPGSGRKPNTPNKGLHTTVRAALEELDLQLIPELYKDIQSMQVGEARAKVLLALCQYVYPKCVEMQHGIIEQGPSPVQINAAIQLLQASMGDSLCQPKIVSPVSLTTQEVAPSPSESHGDLCAQESMMPIVGAKS